MHSKYGLPQHMYLQGNHSSLMSVSLDRKPLTPQFVPETLVDRSSELRTLLELQCRGRDTNLHLFGPRGSGKTLLVRQLLDSSPITTYMLRCTVQNTQYKVLSKLHSLLTNIDFSSGYHTAQLQNRFLDVVEEKQFVLVLDEIDFLLENDGGDLLYFLSRMRGDVSVVSISANNPSLSHVIDERAYSSYRPETLRLEPYTREQIAKILNNRLEAARIRNDVDQATVNQIADTTKNAAFALRWLREAIETTDQAITVDVSDAIYEDAVDSYRNQLLDEFTSHHHLLLEAISQLAFDLGDSAHSGEVFKQYRKLCDNLDESPLSNRRLSDYLEYLELLGIIELERFLGGKLGRTNKITLNKP